MRRSEGEYEFIRLIDFEEHLTLLDAVKPVYEPFQHIWTAYWDGMHRVGAPAMLMAKSLYWTAVTNRAAGWLPMSVGVALEDAKLHGRPGLVEEIQGLMAEESKKIDAGFRRGENRVWQRGAKSLDIAAYIEESPEEKAKTTRKGLDSLYYSMVLNSYAALEAMAGDLWVEAINLCPNKFSHAAGDIYEKWVSVGNIADYGYDVKEKMGSFLKDAGKVDFQTLPNIKKAYAEAFGKASKQYRAFSCNTDLDLTAQVRHLIAHRGGKVDRDFKTGTQAWPDYSNMVEDGYLKLSGTDVCNLINPCVNVAVELLRAVDGWGARHVRRMQAEREQG